MPLEDEIEILIRARYPILYILSSEEHRVEEMVHGVANRREKKLFEWSCTMGLQPFGTSIQSRASRGASTADPLKALDHVVEQVEPAIFLFKDFHPWLGKNHPQVTRRLKEIALHLKNSFKTIVLVSPVFEMPPELEKEITLLNLPLPSREELEGLLDQIVMDVEPFEHVRIELDDTARQRLLQAALGLTLTEAENVFARIIVRDQRLSGDDVDEVVREKQQIIRKSGLLEFCSSEEGPGDVGGLDSLKGWLVKRSQAFTQEARDFGLPAPRGMLLLGTQGCGKSLVAKAVARLWQMPLLRFDMGRMFGSLVGSSEENVRRAIAVAESVSPTILWIDEIDKAFAGSQSSAISDGGTTARVFGTLLTWLSEKTAPVFVVATANDISHLPPELLRKGRLDEIFFVDLPNESERAAIFEIHLLRRGRDPGLFDLDALAQAGDGFSGAEIEQAIVSALYDAFHDGRDVEPEDVLAALQQSVPLSRTMQEQIARLRDWASGRARPATVHAGTED